MKSPASPKPDSRPVRLFKTILRREIEIDFKAFTYFFCVVFFHCAVRLAHGVTSVRILTLAEILICNYVIAYVQNYIFHDFDESDRFGRNEALGLTVCTALYVAASLLLNWFGSSVWLTALFAAYIALCYVCVMLCYIVRRRLDTKRLNRLLENYKKNRL